MRKHFHWKQLFEFYFSAELRILLMNLNASFISQLFQKFRVALQKDSTALIKDLVEDYQRTIMFTSGLWVVVMLVNTQLSTRHGNGQKT